mgnify:CR=1 FL=1
MDALIYRTAGFMLNKRFFHTFDLIDLILTIAGITLFVVAWRHSH